MISCKDIFASEMLNCSLDIFFLLGILVRNSVVAALEVVSLVESVSQKFFADLKMSLGLLEYFDLLLSVYNLDFVQFCRFCLSSTLKKVCQRFSSSNTHMIIARS